MPPVALPAVVPSNVPGPETVKVTEFVAVVTALLLVSQIFEVINEVDAPLAVILVASAVLMSLAGEPGVVVTATELWARFVPVVVTVAVPTVVLDRRRIVAIPEAAFFVDVSRRVPSPETVNVRALVAVVTMLLFVSATLDVTSEVALPSATMLAGLAVFMTFVDGPNVVVTATELWLRFVPVVVTIAVPGVVWDCNVTVAMPLDAFFAVVPSSVP